MHRIVSIVLAHLNCHAYNYYVSGGFNSCWPTCAKQQFDCLSVAGSWLLLAITIVTATIFMLCLLASVYSSRMPNPVAERISLIKCWANAGHWLWPPLWYFPPYNEQQQQFGLFCGLTWLALLQSYLCLVPPYQYSAFCSLTSTSTLIYQAHQYYEKQPNGQGYYQSITLTRKDHLRMHHNLKSRQPIQSQTVTSSQQRNQTKILFHLQWTSYNNEGETFNLSLLEGCQTILCESTKINSIACCEKLKKELIYFNSRPHRANYRGYPSL